MNSQNSKNVQKELSQQAGQRELQKETEEKESKDNTFTFQIGPPTSKNKHPPNMIALKRIENYSYVLSDEIGLGLTSHVYKGRCELTNQPVAVKVIDLKIKNQNEEFQSKFIQDEIQVLQKIKRADATNLLKLECVIQTKNNLYIITEFCEGNDVAKILRKKKRFSQIQAQSIMKQLLNGYKELFNMKIVHRDLKLANIFIMKGLVKIADFGFATSEKMCEKEFDYNVGSPYYMSPEALRDNKYSFSSDVWAIGVMAYQLVYGRVPWKDKDDSVLFTMMTNCPIEKLFDSDKQVSAHYQEFIKSCLNIDIKQRIIPEEVISYPWPLALEHVEGLQQPERSNRLISSEKRQIFRGISNDRQHRILPSMSPERKRQKSIHHKQTQNTSHELQNQSLNQKVSQTPRKGISTPKNSAFDLKWNLIEEQQKINIPNSTQNKNTRNFLNYFGQSAQAPLLKEREVNQKPEKIDSEAKCSQSAILGQIHFCRFIFQLYRLVRDKKHFNELLESLMIQLASRLAEKMKLLMKMVHEEKNVLHSPGFGVFVKTKEWKQLRDIIFQYNMKYNSELKDQEIRAITYFEERKNTSNDILIKNIHFLKTNLPNNLKLMEFLVYYYQAREEDEKSNRHTFYEKTKLEYLVEEAHKWSESGRNQNIRFGGEVKQEQIERLMKKIKTLDI